MCVLGLKVGESGVLWGAVVGTGVFSTLIDNYITVHSAARVFDVSREERWVRNVLGHL